MMNFTFHPSYCIRYPSTYFKDNFKYNKANIHLAFIQNKEAIYLSSVALHNEKETNTDKYLFSLTKYISRLSSRCTPFGLLAGCGIGNWKNENLSLVIADKKYRHTRLDMNVIAELSIYIQAHPSVKSHLIYYPNTSLYKVGEQYRYIEGFVKNKQRRYQISSIDVNEILELVFVKCKSGTTIQQLSDIIKDDEITEQEAIEFIEQLIKEQLLVSELECNVTGNDAFNEITNCLTRICNATNNIEIEALQISFIYVEQLLQSIDISFENEIESYLTIFNILKQLLPNLSEENLFQTDLYFQPLESKLNSSIQTEIVNTSLFLNKLFAENYSNETLKKFKENFISRYENLELPLLEVLDTETGIGYFAKDKTGVNQLANTIFYNAGIKNTMQLQWNETQSMLHKKLKTAEKENLKEVVFTDEDIKNRKENEVIFPPSVSVMFSVINNKNNKIHFKNFSGTSAANLMGRFAHGNSNIHEVIKEIVSHEEKYHEDAIVAEISHLPESRLGNILFRPDFRKYEIPYLAKSLKTFEFQILLDDLMISVQNNKVILRSKRHNKIVIPRLTTAHNYSMSTIPVYQFLCDLQGQYYDKIGLGFSWGSLAFEHTFLPRAVYGNSVLAPAQWNLRKVDFEILIPLLKNYQPEIIENWLKTHQVPKLFLLIDGDNELLVDSLNELSMQSFINEIKKRASITIHEFLFDTDSALVLDKNGNPHTNEIIAVLLNQDLPKYNLKLNDRIVRHNNIIQRNFSVGSEWLFYKVYSGIKTSEKIVQHLLPQIIKELYQKNIIEKWFFIRYADPENHLRIRFKIHPENLGIAIILINKYFQHWIDNKKIENFITDTYSRELERYGFGNIENAESLFCSDSNFSLQLLSIASDDFNGEVIKLKYACLNTIRMLTDFKFNQEQIFTFIEMNKKNYFSEHGGSKTLKGSLDEKYRILKKEFEKIFFQKQELYTDNDKFILSLLDSKKKVEQQVIEIICQKSYSNTLDVDLISFIQSIIHMNVNRLFKAKQRSYELLMYEFLLRGMKTKQAMNKSINKL